MITRLPKSMWLMNAAVSASLVIGSAGVALDWAFKAEFLMIVAMSLVFLCWLTAAASWAFNMYRQIHGAYKDIQPRELKDQVW